MSGNILLKRPHFSQEFLVHVWAFVMQLVVFFSTCDAVDFHYTVVSGFRWSPTPWKGGGGENDERKLLGCDVFRLHGSMAQKDRTETFHQFGKATSAILLCTDVAARGLDFQCVSGIVQYEPPGDAAEYVHRLVHFVLLLVQFRVYEVNHLKYLE